MKYINKIIALLFLVTVTVSCQFSDDDSGPGNDQNIEDGFIEISTEASSSDMIVLGNSSTPESVMVPVFFNQTGIASPDQDVTVTFNVVSVQGDDPSLVFDFPSNTTIPAGELFGNFSVAVNADAQVSGPMIVDVVLTGVTGGFQVGLPDGSRNLTHRIIVNPIFFTEQYDGLSAVPDLAIEFGDNDPFVATLTQADPEVTTFGIDSAWGVNFVGNLAGAGFNGQFTYPADLIIDVETFDVVVDGLGSGLFTGGMGTYDVTTGNISYTLTQALFTGDFDVDIVLTPIIE